MRGEGNPSRAVPLTWTPLSMTPQASRPVIVKQKRVFMEGEKFLCLFLFFLFSLNQHRINRGDNWRAFKLVCDQWGFPRHSNSPGPVTVGLWERPAQHQPDLGSTFTHILSAFSEAPWIPRLLPPRHG